MLKFLFKPSCSYVEVMAIAIAGIGYFAEDNLHYLWVILVGALLSVIGESIMEKEKDND